MATASKAKPEARLTEESARERMDLFAVEIQNAQAELAAIESQLLTTDIPAADLHRRHQATRQAVLDLYRSAARTCQTRIDDTQGQLDKLLPKLATAEQSVEEAIEHAKQILTEAGAGIETIICPNGQPRLIDYNPIGAEGVFHRRAAAHVSTEPAREALFDIQDQVNGIQVCQSLWHQDLASIKARISADWAALTSGK